MTYRIVPRSETGLPDPPTNMSGSPRPVLGKGREGLTVHYVGAGQFARRDAAEAVVAIEQFARSPQKKTPFEYNYVIGQTDDDLVFEYAGHHRAAHSRNNNSTYFGVCLLNGVDESPTDRQISKVRWLRHSLTSDGWIKSGGALLPHRQMPGQVGATACPGDRIVARWADFDRPWSGDDATPASEPAATGDGVGHHLVRAGESARSIAELHFGDGSREAEITDANDGAIPAPGARCKVPGVPGTFVTVEAGWGAFSCIRAAEATPSAAAVEQFWRWNGGNADGGERGPLIPGEVVWVPADPS